MLGSVDAEALMKIAATQEQAEISRQATEIALRPTSPAVISVEYGGVPGFLVRHGYGPGARTPYAR